MPRTLPDCKVMAYDERTRREAVHGFVIAGTQSGVGKTTLTLGVLAALRKRGLSVQPFKIGPDFIDPGHHTAVTGVPSRNLDGWMLSRAYNTNVFNRSLYGHDVGVVEGMMGLFDGYDGKSEAGSTAEMAKWLGLPVLLVVDASAMARSVAAVIHGFQHFDSELNVAGVIFNKIGGPGHLRYLEEAVRDVPNITVLGGLPADETITLPERHLGLVTREEQQLSAGQIDHLAGVIEAHLDLSSLLRLSASPTPSPQSQPDRASPASPVRFGIARDEAFCFYYPDNLELLEHAGAILVFFSPLHDSRLPPDLHGLYLGGGYPEVHAQILAANTTMRQEMKDFIQDGRTVYAECGGLMYLTQGIRDVEGHDFPMVGVYPTTVRMRSRLSGLGYAEVTIPPTNDLFPALRVRGHEFHYSELVPDLAVKQARTLYQVRQRAAEATRPEGYVYKRCLASYIHLHFGSNPAFAQQLVRLASA